MADELNDISLLLQQTAAEVRKKKEESLTAKSQEVEDIFSEWDFSKDTTAGAGIEEDVVPFGTALSSFKKKKKEVSFQTKLILVACCSGIIGVIIYYYYLMPLLYENIMQKVERYVIENRIDKADSQFDIASIFRFNSEEELGDYINILLKHNQLNIAKKYIDKMLIINKESEIGLDYLIKYYIKSDQINLAEKYDQEYMNKHKASYKLFFNRAEIALRKGQIDEAIKNYTNSYIMKDDYLEAYLKLRKLYVENKMYQKVIEMQNYIEGLPQPPQPDYNTYFDLGIAYYNLSRSEGDRKTTAQERDILLKKAKDYFEKCTHSNPHAPFPYWILGTIYEDIMNYELALKNYTEYSKLKPNDAKAYASLGILYYKNHNIKEAVKNLQKATILDPSLIRAHYYTGHLFLYEFDDAENAVNEYNKVLNSNEKVNDLLFHLGVAYFKNKNYEKSVKFFSEYLNSKENDLDANYNMAVAYILNNKPVEALTYFNIVSKKLEENPKYYNNVAACYELLNQEKDAVKNYWKAMQILEATNSLKDNPFIYNNFKRYISKAPYTKIEEIVDLNLRLKPVH